MLSDETFAAIEGDCSLVLTDRQRADLCLRFGFNIDRLQGERDTLPKTETLEAIARNALKQIERLALLGDYLPARLLHQQRESHLALIEWVSKERQWRRTHKRSKWALDVFVKDMAEFLESCGKHPAIYWDEDAGEIRGVFSDFMILMNSNLPETLRHSNIAERALKVRKRKGQE